MGGRDRDASHLSFRRAHVAMLGKIRERHKKLLPAALPTKKFSGERFRGVGKTKSAKDGGTVAGEDDQKTTPPFGCPARGG